jgi:hypothetical protein
MHLARLRKPVNGFQDVESRFGKNKEHARRYRSLRKWNDAPAFAPTAPCNLATPAVRLNMNLAFA